MFHIFLLSNHNYHAMKSLPAGNDQRRHRNRWKKRKKGTSLIFVMKAEETMWWKRRKQLARSCQIKNKCLHAWHHNTYVINCLHRPLWVSWFILFAYKNNVFSLFPLFSLPSSHNYHATKSLPYIHIYICVKKMNSYMLVAMYTFIKLQGLRVFRLAWLASALAWLTY